MRVDVTGVKPNGTFDSLLRTIGFVVVQWGHCEQSLELLVNTLFRAYGGNALPKRKRMPRPVSEKILFLRECCAQISSLATFRIEIELLADEFERLMPLRHDLVHGALSETTIKNGVCKFIRLDAHPDIHEVKEFLYDLNDFPALEEQLMSLGKKAIAIARRVFQAAQKPP